MSRDHRTLVSEPRVHSVLGWRWWGGIYRGDGEISEETSEDVERPLTEGFGVEHNSWEPWDNVHALELVTDFYWRHPGAACHICAVDFHSIPFCSVSGRHCLKGGWMLGMLRFIWRFLQQRSVNSVHPSSSSLAQDRGYRSLTVMWHCILFLQSRDVATFCISITFSPFFIFFIILLFQLWFLVYRHASHLSRALSFSFRIPC